MIRVNSLVKPWMIFLYVTVAGAYQNDIQFQNIAEGLSQQTVTSILQESKGYMWFGTLNGLNRYDGIHFTNYEMIPGDSSSLLGNRIYQICEDTDGSLWIATDRGLNRYNRNTDKFIRYYHEEDNNRSLSDNVVQDVFVDSKGSVWVVAGGLCLYNRDTDDFTRMSSGSAANFIYEDRQGQVWTNLNGKFYLFDDEKQEFITPAYLNTVAMSATMMVEDEEGFYWIGTNDQGLLCSRLGDQSPRFDSYRSVLRTDVNIDDYRILELIIDREGQLWISCENGGLFVFDRQKQLRYRFIHKPGETNAISFNSIWSIYQDSIGRMWLGTWNSGVDIIDPYVRKFLHYKFEKGENSLTHNQVTSFVQDKSGNVWIGMDGGGLDYFDRKRQVFTSFIHDQKNPSSISANAVMCLCMDDDGRLWAGTYSGGVNMLRDDKKSFVHYNSTNSILENNDVFAILNGGEANIFIGLWQGGLCIHNIRTRKWESYRHDPSDDKTISANGVFSLYKDHNGKMWVGTEAGLDLFERDQNGKGYFVHYNKEYSNIAFYCMCEDENNNFWVGTNNGLLLFDREKGTSKVYRKEQGLPNNEILGLQSNKGNSLWISTNNGLSHFDTEKEVFRNYDMNDGLQSFQFNRNSSYRSRTGEMFFGGVKGFNVFYPDSVKDNPFPPEVVLSDFRLFNKKVAIGGKSPLQKPIGVTQEMTLAYNQSVFTIEFVALNYTHPGKNQYAYMMEGFEQDWNYAGLQRNATYTNLDPGTYIFKVKAANNDGVWNNTGTSLTITITPPFWRTWWFRICVILIILGAAYLWYYQRMSRVRKQNLELEEKVRKRTQALQERTDQLNQKTVALEIAKKETDDILHTVGEGLFLLNRDYQIGSQYASILEKIFERGELGRINFFSILEDGIVSEKVSTIKRYLGLLFNNDIDELMLESLNPLAQIEINFKKIKRIKYLTFEFRRIYNKEGAISELMAAVRDITEQVLLEQKLVESEKRTNRQLNWLLSILHVEPEMLQDFIEGVQREVDFIETVLDLQQSNESYKLRLEKIYRSMHLIKGNASLLALKFFADQAHEFEDIISDIQKKDNILADDFDSLRKKLKEMRDSINDVNGLLDKIHKLHTQMGSPSGLNEKMLVQSLVNLTKDMSGDLGKDAMLKYSNFSLNDIPHKNQLMVKEVLIQLIRNSLAHGIELPDERKKAGKPAQAMIEIDSIIKEGMFIVSIRDDGRGLQLDQLKKRALESGKWREEEVEGWTREQLINTIFMSGISTSREVDQTAGRGVGMSLVKEKVESHQGTIETTFEAGKYCKFKIMLPI